MSETKYLDRQEVCKLLGISVDSGTIYKLVKDGRLACELVPNKKKFGAKFVKGYPEKSVLNLVSEINYEKEIEPSFGYYFSGLVDGEGSFTIITGSESRYKDKSGKQRTYRFNHAYLKIGMRADDVRLIIWIRKNLGFGTINMNKLYKNHSKNAKPSATFQTTKQKDNLAVIKLLDKYPLHGKKANDYLIWKKYVLERSKPECSQRYLDSLATEIRKIREYSEPTRDDIKAVEKLNRESRIHISGTGLGLIHK